MSVTVSRLPGFAKLFVADQHGALKTTCLFRIAFCATLLPSASPGDMALYGGRATWASGKQER
jgi:hypothetical protein